MIRNFLRYIGLLCILAVYIASGLQKITQPALSAALLAKSNFPRMLNVVGVTLTPHEYTYLIQATGAIFVSFSLFILLGVGRSFFSFLLAIGTVIITLAFHVNLENPQETSEEQLQHVFKNLSIVGAFLFVSGSGHRRGQYSRAREANVALKAKKSK